MLLTCVEVGRVTASFFYHIYVYFPPPKRDCCSWFLSEGAAVFTLRGERKVKEIGIGWCNLWIADTEQRLKEKEEDGQSKKGN